MVVAHNVLKLHRGTAEGSKLLLYCLGYQDVKDGSGKDTIAFLKKVGDFSRIYSHSHPLTPESFSETDQLAVSSKPD